MAFVECNLPHPWEGGLTTRMGACLGESAPSSEAERDTLQWSGRNTEIPPWFLGTNSQNLIFTPTWGRCPIRLIFFRWVGRNGDFSKFQKIQIFLVPKENDAHWKGNRSSQPLKIKGWKMIHFLFVAGPIFQGRAVRFRECIIAKICQCQWIFLMKPRLFRLGTFWPYCRWIHLLSILMVNSPVYWLQMIDMNMRPTSCVFHHVPWDSETFKLIILTGKLFPEMPIIKDGHRLYRSDFSCNVPWRWVRRHQWWTLLQGGRDDVSIGIYVSHHQEVKIHLWFIFAYLWISLFSLVDQEEKGISFNAFFFAIFT